MRRVAVLFSRLSGYTVACLRTLSERHKVELLVIRHPLVHEAPFEESTFQWIHHLYNRDQMTTPEMLAIVRDFKPHAILMSGWFDKGYLKVAREMRKQGVPVVAGSDTQWKGSVRQQVARLASPWYLKPAIDALWVPGERQRQLAERLGYRGGACWVGGSYACDWSQFSQVFERANEERPRSFLYVGRYVPVKGLDVLLEGYKIYRTLVAEPWPLICAGAGPEEHMLSGKEGVVNKGFVQPQDLPVLLSQAGAFILSSRKEPWGVVLQEAAAAGLPLICSDVCGAAVHLLQDRYNGRLFESGNPRHLAQCMASLSSASDEDLSAMSARSYSLAKQFTPERWADTLMEGLATMVSH